MTDEQNRFFNLCAQGNHKTYRMVPTHDYVSYLCTSVTLLLPTSDCLHGPRWIVSACLIFNIAIVWLRNDIGSKLWEKESIWQYATSGQKLPIIDASSTSIFPLQSYAGKHMLQQHYNSSWWCCLWPTECYKIYKTYKCMPTAHKDGTFYLYRINNIPICHHCIE